MTLPAQDIVERLRSWDRCYPGNINIESSVDDALAELSRLTADNEALRAELAEARAAHHRTSHKAVKRLRALWREKQAAEKEVERKDAALRRIADGNLGDASWQADYGKIREVALAALGERP